MKPSLLVNENFPHPATLRLRGAGYDVIAIAEMQPGMPDAEVLALASSQARWLITFDRDYGELAFARRMPTPPAIILIRLSSYRAVEAADALLAALQAPEELLGRFTVLGSDKPRSRPLLASIGDER
jgi:predicted nuclease of predicted toxin-antitoxin system